MFEQLRNYIRRLAPPEPVRRTRVSVGGAAEKLFAPQERSRAKIREYRTIYEQGGIVAEIIDAYALYAITNGYRLQGADEADVAAVQEVLDRIGFYDLVWSAIVDGYGWAGDAIQEIVFTRGGDIYGVEPRDPSTFEIDADEYGNVVRYRQVFDELDTGGGTVVEPEFVIRFSPRRLSGKVYGEPLIKRAYDEIMRDAETAEAARKAIKRHGTAKWHIKIAPADPKLPVADDIPVIRREFENIESDNEFVTDDKVDVVQLDTGGAGPVAEYGDIALQRLCAACGVPEEMIGLRRGTTDATASSRMQAFYGKIGALQRKIADVYNTQLIDRITGSPGAVKLVFNDVNPVDEATKSVWIARIMQSTGAQPFAVLPRAWVASQFGISEDMLEPYSPEAVSPGATSAMPDDTEPGEAELEARELARGIPDDDEIFSPVERDIRREVDAVREKVLAALKKEIG